MSSSSQLPEPLSSRGLADVLLEMYKLQIGRTEHYERQREGFTRLLLVLAASFVAIASWDGIGHADWLPGLMVLGTGLFGVLATRQYDLRCSRHANQCTLFREHLDGLYEGQDVPSSPGISDKRDWARKRVEWKARARMRDIAGARDEPPDSAVPRTYLNRLWMGLHLGVAGVGGLIVVLARYAN